MPKNWESAIHRAREDEKKWLFGSFWGGGISVLFTGAAGVLATTLAAPAVATVKLIIYGVAGGISAYALIVFIAYAVHLVLALKRQRDEARMDYDAVCERSDFINAIKNGDTIKKENIKMSLLFDQHYQLNDITFDRCTLSGPAMIELIHDADMGGSEYGYGSGRIDDFLTRKEEGKAYIGTGRLSDCKFLYCTLENLGFIAPDELYEKLRANAVRD